MVDSRYPTYYLNDRRVRRLSDAAHRAFVNVTAFCVENRTDGFLDREDVDLVPNTNTKCMDELMERGLATGSAKGWQLTDYGKTQSSAAQLDNALLRRRESDRDRQQRHREKQKQDPRPGMSRSQSRDRHVTSGGEARRGEERRGKASFDGRSSFNPQAQEASPDSELQENKDRTDATPSFMGEPDSTLAGEDRLVSGVADDSEREVMGAEFDLARGEGGHTDFVGWTAEVVKPGEGRVNEVTGEIADAVPLLPPGVRPCVRQGCDRARAAGNLNCSEHASAGTVLESSRWGEVS
ncbi:hypothetical protein [Kocuria sp. CPCC 204721]|uniref:hypothetical protein n=1 Tax=Kocuria sp. CPCC 204721 TaxID=3073548 RepID=UPI0034D4275F